ncbi:MAG: glycosyltransferase family 2 protein [Candidatus Shapirobacteria bacterium]
MSNVSIIIPSYNGVTYLEDCLKALIKSISLCSNSKFEIILVDNGSSDNSVEVFNKVLAKQDKTVIYNKINRGFAPAVNQGIIKAKYEYVCLLNNDLTLEPDWFPKIINAIERSKNNRMVTFCGSVLNKAGTHYESTGLNFKYSGKCENIDSGKVYDKKENQRMINSIIWGSTAAVIVYHRQTLINIGLFDEDFFAYEEDVDVNLRLHKLGYKTLLVPSAISYHLGGGTSKKMGNFRHIHDSKNWIFIIQKLYTKKELIDNIFQIIEERLRNMSGLIKQTVKIDRFKSIITVPQALFHAYFPVLAKHSRTMSKRRIFFDLMKNKT